MTFSTCRISETHRVPVQLKFPSCVHDPQKRVIPDDLPSAQLVQGSGFRLRGLRVWGATPQHVDCSDEPMQPLPKLEAKA